MRQMKFAHRPVAIEKSILHLPIQKQSSLGSGRNLPLDPKMPSRPTFVCFLWGLKEINARRPANSSAQLGWHFRFIPQSLATQRCYPDGCRVKSIPKKLYAVKVIQEGETPLMGSRLMRVAIVGVPVSSAISEDDFGSERKIIRDATLRAPLSSNQAINRPPGAQRNNR